MHPQMFIEFIWTYTSGIILFLYSTYEEVSLCLMFLPFVSNNDDFNEKQDQNDSWKLVKPYNRCCITEEWSAEIIMKSTKT